MNFASLWLRPELYSIPTEPNAKRPRKRRDGRELNVKVSDATAIEILRRHCHGGESLASLGAEYGISPHLLYRWKTGERPHLMRAVDELR